MFPRKSSLIHVIIVMFMNSNRVTIVRKDNERLQKELDALRVERAEREKKPESQGKDAPKKEVKKDSRRIPGTLIY